jgi:alkyldihydroxyacetonephosphate synthase
MALPLWAGQGEVYARVGRGSAAIVRAVSDTEAATRRLSWWGWGYEDEALGAEEAQRLAALVGPLLGLDGLAARPAPRIEDVDLPSPRITSPPALRPISSNDHRDRAAHAYGRSFADVVRAFEGRIEHPPDLVLRPRNEAEVGATLEWCTERSIACIPYGGGTSVVGGVEPKVGDTYRAAVSLDMRAMGRLLDVDTTSRAAHIEAGVLGPSLEEQLRAHNLTMRHYPQSFQFSTLGGWLATRSGGHYATLHTHIDDFVESMRVLTPRGPIETRRLPASGAGPSPDRLFLGSEGILGVITQAWMRLQQPPTHRAQAALRFSDFDDAVAATRVVAQSGLNPASCRLLDHLEALVSGSGDGSASLLLLGFESHDHPCDAQLERAVEIARDHNGIGDERDQRGGTADPTSTWRNAFLRAPYIRDALVAMGVISETFETAITWDAFADYHQRILRTAREHIGKGLVSCRFTHVYPDGPAPYYTVIAASRPGDQLPQWRDIKQAVSDAIIDGGGTITHHHAVGRDHRPWYDRQRPPLFADALRSAKRTLDPAGILNPGVLVDPLT